MKKHTISILIFFCLFWAEGFSQHHINVGLRGISEDGYQGYFNNVHKSKKAQIDSVKKSSWVIALFTILPAGDITDFEFVSIPGISIDSVTSKYLKSLFFTANGKWEYKENGIPSPTSKKVMFLVSMLKANQSLHEKGEQGLIADEYRILQLSEQQRRLGVVPGSEQLLSLSF
jgi:hypothetical protein